MQEQVDSVRIQAYWVQTLHMNFKPSFKVWLKKFEGIWRLRTTLKTAKLMILVNWISECAYVFLFIKKINSLRARNI